MNIDISGKVVIITGAAKGIGKVLAEKFANEGAKLSLWDIEYEELLHTANSISQQFAEKPLALNCDVRDEKQVNEAIKRTLEIYGTIDILVANAGILNADKILETSVDKWDQVFDVNVKGAFLCSKGIALYL